MNALSLLMAIPLLLLWTTGAAAGTPAGSNEDKQKKPPPYQLLRFMEDYTYLDKNPSDDFWDRGKNVKLSEAWRITLGGQERIRYEHKENLGFGGAVPATDGFVINRLRGHVDAKYRNSFRIFADVKSAVSYDKDGSKAATDDSIDTQNLFLEFITHPNTTDALSFRVGRQELVFGNQRLISNLIWANVLRTFDGFRFTYNTRQGNGNRTISGWWARFVNVKDHELNSSDQGLQTFGLYAATALSGKSGYDLYAIGKRQTDQTTSRGSATDKSVAIGTRLWGGLTDLWQYEAELAAQPGRLGDENTFAWMSSTTLGVALPYPVVEKVSFGYDFASGDGSGTGEDTFDQYFPLGHAYLGYIDVVGRANIHAVNTRLDFSVIPKTTSWIQLHSFWLASVEDGLYNPGGTRIRSNLPGNGSDHVGIELDIATKISIDRHSVVLLGYSHFWPGSFIENTGAAEDIDFIYAQYQFTF